VKLEDIIIIIIIFIYYYHILDIYSYIHEINHCLRYVILQLLFI